MNNESPGYHVGFTTTFIRNQWKSLAQESGSGAQSAEELISSINEGSVFILGAKVKVQDKLPER